jgi:hypothetical protein
VNEDHDEIIHLSLDETSGSPPVDLETLSPEARLATALVMQAQALEGMRRTQADLIRRVGDGGDRRPGRDVIRRVQSRLEDLRRGQKKAVSQLRRLRRRAQWMVLVSLFIGAGVASITTWWLGPGLAGGVQVATLGSGNGMPDAVLNASHVEQTAVLESRIAGLKERLGARETELELAQASASQLILERDAAQARVIELDAAVTQIAADGRVVDSELLAATGRLDAARDERNHHIGAASRLRSKLIDKDQQIETMQASLSVANARIESMSVAPVSVSTDSGVETLAEQVNLALAASGVESYEAIEVGEVRGGSLRNLMLLHETGEGQERTILNGQVAAVVFDRGEVTLRLSNDDLLVADIPLPRADAMAWADLGVTVPEHLGPVLRVREALDVLLAGQELKVVRLGNVADGRLLEIELEGGGRTLRAARGHVTSHGPTLVLEQGTVIRDGEERSFFNGVMRLPLTPTAYAGWSSTMNSLFGKAW